MTDLPIDPTGADPTTGGTSLRDIFGGRAAINFRPIWRVALTASVFLVIGSVLLLTFRWLNLSIDFEGGGVWEVPVSESVTVADARDVLPAAIGPDAKIQLVGGASDGTVLRVQGGTDAVSESDIIAASLAELAGTSSDDVVISTIGPTWGEQITRQALSALAWFFLAVALYLAWRLEWRMAIAAVIAVIHDLVITAGVYSLFAFEVSPATIIALLTILGYSLYDTVVVFDKVLENDDAPSAAGMDDVTLVNHSMNQVLMRSINTTLTTVLPVLSMLIIGGVVLGGTSLQGFALALFIGLLLGTYSSIFVAAPMLVWLRGMRPEAKRAAEIRARRQERTGADGAAAGPVAADRDVTLVSPGGSAPRPRKKGRRR